MIRRPKPTSPNRFYRTIQYDETTCTYPRFAQANFVDLEGHNKNRDNANAIVGEREGDGRRSLRSLRSSQMNLLTGPN